VIQIFLAQNALLAIRFILDLQHICPINGLCKCFELLRCVTIGIESADHRADARTHDQINRHMRRIEHIQHPDMCEALHAPTRQHQRYPRWEL